MDSNRIVTRSMYYNFDKVDNRLDNRKVKTFHVGENENKIELRNISSSFGAKPKQQTEDQESMFKNFF